MDHHYWASPPIMLHNRRSPPKEEEHILESGRLILVGVWGIFDWRLPKQIRPPPPFTCVKTIQHPLTM